MFTMIGSLSNSALTLKDFKYRYSELPVISISVEWGVFIYLYVDFF